MARRMDLLNKITKQLAILAHEVELMNRSNRSTLNSDAETIFCGLINRLEGWELRNLNEVEQNYPGIDLADTGRRIAVQITASATTRKVDHTLEVFFKNKMERDFDRLVVVIITDKQAPTAAHGVKQGFKFDPKKDIWNIEWFKRRVESIEDCEQLQAVADYLDSQLGDLPGTVKRPDHLLPPAPVASESFLAGSRDEELAVLEAALDAGKPVFIWGLGGMGKTQTAIELARRCAPEKGAYFLRYTIPSDPTREAMRETILQARFTGYWLDAGEETDPEILMEKEYREKLEILQREYAGTMLIIDNFDWLGKSMEMLKAEQSYQDIAALANCGVQLVFTTRYPSDPAWEVGPLPERWLLELMRRSCAAHTDEELLALIRAVDGHTLMVELMAKTLEESWNTVTPARILAALERVSLDIADFPEVTSDKDGQFAQARIHRHLLALFDLSGLTEDARNVLGSISLLPGDGLADSLLMRCFSDGQQQELRSLVKRGWLRREQRRISMHPAVAQVCAGALELTGEDPFLAALWTLFEQGECDEDALRPTAETFAAAAQRVREPDAAMDYVRKALAAWRERMPGADWDQAEYDNWVDPYKSLGDLKKTIHFKSMVLATKKQHRPENDPAVAAGLDYLGRVHRAAEDYTQALEYSRKSLELWSRIYDGPNPNLARGYSSMARTWYEMGELSQALDCLNQALLVWIRILKPGHPYILATERNIELVKAEMNQ